MSYNSFGHLFRVTTWGESHGSTIGCIIDGCPPLISFTQDEIQYHLDRRRPGKSRFTTQRQEKDEVQILSGVLPDPHLKNGYITTGTPISMSIKNTDQRSKDYSKISEQYRPGHADYTYDIKYGIRDYNGSGRASARETAVRVAAGAIARKIVPNLVVRGALVSMGECTIDRSRWDWSEVDRNPFFLPDAESVSVFSDYLDKIRLSCSSIGALIEIIADGVPPGLGAPLYGKLDQDLASLLMSINAVKGVEIGSGFSVVSLRGEENGDGMRYDPLTQKPIYLSNHCGGILGGISTGSPIVARFAVKPTSSIQHPQPSITKDGTEIDVQTKGRHDPCVGIRAVPVGEAMVACVLADHYLRHRGQCGPSSEPITVNKPK